MQYEIFFSNNSYFYKIIFKSFLILLGIKKTLRFFRNIYAILTMPQNS